MFVAQADFVYKDHIIPELKLNHHNVLKLFREKLPQDTKLLQNLILTNVLGTEAKQNLLSYIKDSGLAQKIKKEVFQDPFIQAHLKNGSDRKIDNILERQYMAMERQLIKKSGNNQEPATFYNEYVDLITQVRKCFQYKTHFREESLSSRIPTFQKRFVFEEHFKCQACGKQLKNASGLGSHKRTCKKLKKPEQIDVRQETNDLDDSDKEVRRRLPTRNKPIQKYGK